MGASAVPTSTCHSQLERLCLSLSQALRACLRGASSQPWAPGHHRNQEPAVRAREHHDPWVLMCKMWGL